MPSYPSRSSIPFLGSACCITSLPRQNSCRVRQVEPLLEEVDAQHGLGGKGLLAAPAALGLVGLHQCNQVGPWHDLLHRIQELPLACAFAGLGLHQAGLLHGMQSSCLMPIRASTSPRDSCRPSLSCRSALGACQGSCRLIHARRGALSSADTAFAMGSESRSGLSLITAM